MWRDVKRIMLDSRNTVRAKLKRTDYPARKVLWRNWQELRGYQALSLLLVGRGKGGGVEEEQRDGARLLSLNSAPGDHMARVRILQLLPLTTPRIFE